MAVLQRIIDLSRVGKRERRRLILTPARGGTSGERKAIFTLRENRMFKFRLCALAFLFAQFAGGACAQSYPTKSIRYIIGSSVGGSADVIARLLGGALTQRLGQSVVVDPRPGAGA